MKSILSLLVLICSVAVITVSCAKKDDSTAAAAAGDIAGTGTTASGTITGNDNLTGVFATSWYGYEPSGGCVDNSTGSGGAITAHSYLASDAQSFKKMWIVTGASSFTMSEVQYSDTNCSTMTAYFNKLADNVTIGSALTGLTAGSDPAFPTSANKISYTYTKYSIFANTTVTVASYLSRLGVTLTSGEEKEIDEPSPAIEYNLIAAGDTTCGISQTKRCLYLGDGSSADNKTDWGSSDTYWKE